MVGIEERLRVEIVEHNNEVFPIFIRDFGSKLKSGNEMVLVRFDSYADFLVPKDLQADAIEQLDHLVDSIDNQSWILPAVYRGHIKKILWFKPPWAHQFQDGKYELQVGKCQQTGLLKIASTIPYFTSNCVYSSNEKLSNIHTVEILILTAGLTHNLSESKQKSQTPVYDHYSGSESLDSDSHKKVKLSTSDINHKDTSAKKQFYQLDTTLIEQLLEDRSYLLDIDLSFFSTDDSIRKQFDENEYEILRYVYARIVQETTDSEILQYITSREATLKQIQSLMEEYLTEPKIDQPIFTENPYLSALISVIRYKKMNWKAVHNYGKHLADTRPPLHVSSEEMVIYLLESVGKVLQLLKKEPVLITISRCVDDGYCSLEQADLIQKNVEKKLRNLYKIDKTVGKSLYTQDDEDEDDEINRNDTTDDKPINMSDDEHSRSSMHHEAGGPDNSTVVKPLNTGKEAKDAVSIPSATQSSLAVPASSSPSNKTEASPREITKARSPSSLSEASPSAD